MEYIGKVLSLHRYPVKSMVGEDIQTAEVSREGFYGDRVWAVRNLDANEQQGARKLPKLLGIVATSAPRDRGHTAAPPLLRFPDGETIATDDPRASARVSHHLGKRVALVPLAPRSNFAHYRVGRFVDGGALRREMGVNPGEDAPDMSSLPLKKLSELGIFATPPGTYFDAYPIHVLTTASLGFVASRSGNPNIDPRRYRPNIVVDSGETEALLEAQWEGARLEVGSCVLSIEAPTVRCSMPGRAQAVPGIDADKEVVRAVAQHADRHLGAYATVVRPGQIAVGDPVRLLSAEPRPIADRLRRLEQALSRRALKWMMRDRDT
ncbi:MAG: MOSC domain-containing protein [Myxococcota bacterium]